MDHVRIGIDRDNRFMLLRLLFADEHLQESLSQAQVPPKDNLFVRDIEPDSALWVEWLGCG
jgi:hypothetical protein